MPNVSKPSFCRTRVYSFATPDSESCYFWRGIERIEGTATHAFFYLLTIQAIIVPARAFRSEAQFRAFVDHARALWTTSQEGRP